MDTLNLVCQYLRMVSYAVVVLSSLRNILGRKFGGILFVGDILVAIALFFSSLHVTFLGKDRVFFEICLITPATMVWAIIHFRTLILSMDLEEGKNEK